MVELTPEERHEIIQNGFINVKRFSPGVALNRIEEIYQSVSILNNKQ